MARIGRLGSAGRGMAILLAALVGTAGIVRAAEAPRIRHRPLAYYVAGHRVEVLASVSDESGVETVRCYFRQKGAAAYSFVEMEPVGGDQYRGVLPAPADSGEDIEYMFAVVTGAGCIFATAPFVVPPANEQQAERTPRWQQVPEDTPLSVGTEADVAPGSIPGFDDVLELTSVPADQRLGLDAGPPADAPEEDEERDRQVAAGILPLGGLRFCGVIPARSTQAGFLNSPKGVAVVGAGIAAAGGGVAAAAGGGGGGGGGGGATPPDICQDFFASSTGALAQSFLFTPSLPACNQPDFIQYVYAFTLGYDAMGSDANTFVVEVGGVPVASVGPTVGAGVLPVAASSTANGVTIRVNDDGGDGFAWGVATVDAVCVQCVPGGVGDR